MVDYAWCGGKSDNLLSPHQTIALKYSVGQKKGRGYCYNLHHSVACKFQSPGNAILPAPSNKVKKNRGDFGKSWLGVVT
ncbi:hypothetical protein llap_7757 [Limosa lapponica baueri]|uniref:Uncharacterized protein n=1 Tax=Limosa lapponica baueri TaxID=1758121 RepID=A0A2I0U779_LIMLA|nr:hypothetical protein llap_7757 [Limosa lapponica baueri]